MRRTNGITILFSSHTLYLLTGARDMIEWKYEIRTINRNDLAKFAPILAVLSVGKREDGYRIKDQL
jgi:hypothetical protein